jgi:hypothetical protein
MLPLRGEGKKPNLVERLKVVIREALPEVFQIGALVRRHASVCTAVGEGHGKYVLRGWIETDGYPWKIRISLGYREQERSLLNPEIATKDSKGAGGRKAPAGSCEVALNLRQDVFGVDFRSALLSGSEK